MRLLLFSDLHCDKQAAAELVAKAAGVDLVIGAGDFGQCRFGVGICFEVLKEISVPAVLTPGNAENVQELREAAACWPSAHVLHGKGEQVAGVECFGLGGAIPPPPFGSWSFNLTEEEAAEQLKRLPRGAILIVHSPPKGAVDLDGRGRSLGSTAIRDAVLAMAPRLVVCGHIHASAGKQSRLGDSLVINAGPRGVLFDLD